MFIMTFMTYCERASNTFKNGLPSCTVYNVQCTQCIHCVQCIADTSLLPRSYISLYNSYGVYYSIYSILCVVLEMCWRCVGDYISYRITIYARGALLIYRLPLASGRKLLTQQKYIIYIYIYIYIYLYIYLYIHKYTCTVVYYL